MEKEFSVDFQHRNEVHTLTINHMGGKNAEEAIERAKRRLAMPNEWICVGVDCTLDRKAL